MFSHPDQCLSNVRSNVTAHLLNGGDASTSFENEPTDRGSLTEVQHGQATTEAHGWCEAKLDEVADGVDPNSRGAQDSKRMLDRQDMNEWYLEYLQAMEDRNNPKVVCPSTFAKVYSLARKKLNIWDRKWIPFAQCSTCAELKLKLSKSTSSADRDKVRKERSAHLVFQRRMREAYYKNRELASKEPATYMSTICDGMDQAKVRVPRFGRASKGLNHQMDLGLEGVLFHGPLKRMDFYMIPHTYKGGSNVTIHCLNESLKRMQAAYKDRGLQWPTTWCLQLDNTTKENKNQFVLAWLQMPVDTHVFDEILVSFLPVGHTHEDIDQRFSVISRALRTENILSVQHMREFLSTFFKATQNLNPIV